MEPCPETSDNFRGTSKSSTGFRGASTDKGNICVDKKAEDILAIDLTGSEDNVLNKIIYEVGDRVRIQIKHQKFLRKLQP